MHRDRSWLWFCPIGFAALTACSGTIEGGASERLPGSAGHRAGAPGNPTNGGVTGSSDPGPASATPPHATLQRLTSSQYRNTVAALFGADVTIPALDVDPSVAGFVETGASVASASHRGVEQYADAASSIAHQVVGDQARRTALGGCQPANATGADDACARSIVDRVGRRLFRRPLSDDERSRYVVTANDAAKALGSFWDAIEGVLSAMLQSPQFLYRYEAGADGAPGPRRLAGYELASRLSFALHGAAPDDALLEIAAKGQLGSDDGLRSQVAAMLAQPRARAHLKQFFGQMFDLPQPAPGAAESNRDETLLVIDDIVATGAPYTDVFTTTTTFVNDALAKLYGLTVRPGAKLTKTTLPPEANRRGLLGHAALLTNGSDGAKTSATARGRTVRTSLLCDEVPPPPDGVVAMLPMVDPAKPQTARERLEVHRKVPACATCHALMDPLGLALEHYDGTAKYRSDDSGLPIDASGELDGMRFEDGPSLGAVLARDPRTGTCLARSVYRFVVGAAEAPEQEAYVAALDRALVANGHRVLDLFASAAASEAFTTVSDPQ